LRYADLHCDTLSEIFIKNKNLFFNDLNVDIKKIIKFKKSILFLAIWLDDIFLDKPFENSVKILDYFYKQKDKYKKYFSGNHKFILSLEGGEALEDDADNLDLFYKLGIRLLTLTWNCENNLAGGCESEVGLKKFGYQILEKARRLNMIIDISHSSKKTFWDVYNFNNKNILASHSNANKVRAHKRNLDDDQILAIKSCQGLIGLNLYNKFLTYNEIANLKDIFNHIEHFLKLGCENVLCLGCDFDGVNNDLPNGIHDIKDTKKIYYFIKVNFGKKIADKIFYFNIKNFLHKRKI
jgi:membrane dipeptidase